MDWSGVELPVELHESLASDAEADRRDRVFAKVFDNHAFDFEGEVSQW